MARCEFVAWLLTIFYERSTWKITAWQPESWCTCSTRSNVTRVSDKITGCLIPSCKHELLSLAPTSRMLSFITMEAHIYVHSNVENIHPYEWISNLLYKICHNACAWHASYSKNTDMTEICYLSIKERWNVSLYVMLW